MIAHLAARDPLIRLIVASALGVMVSVSSACSSNHCSTSADCNSGEECVNSACVVPGGADRCPGGADPCSQSSDCISLSCNAGCCAPPCTSASECASGDTCTNGACVAPQTSCRNDSECTAVGMPVCLTATKTCVACMTTADCQNPAEMCTTDNQCVFLPGMCGQSSDCATDGGTSTPVCDTTTGFCVGCAVNSDCAAGDVCSMENQTCIPAPAMPCTTTAECNSGDAGTETPYCDTTHGICVQCLMNGNCSADDVCRVGECVPAGGCQTNLDCTNSALPYCLDADGGCVQCLSTVQCQPPLACMANSCGACSMNADCAGSVAGNVCDVDGGSCVQCLQNSDCSRTGATCTSGSCVGGECTMDSDCANDPSGSYCNSDAGSCVECLMNSQCTTNLVCTDDSCQIPTCSSDTDCMGVATGPHCDPATMHCVECVDDSQCSGGLTCQSNACMLQSCMTAADCSSDVGAPYCDPGMKVCVECESDAECTSGMMCIDGTCGTAPTCTADSKCSANDACVPLPADNNTVWTERCIPANAAGNVLGGAACGSNSDCRSGSCYFLPGETQTDGICLDACQSVADCDSNGTTQCPNNGVAITIPGTMNLAPTPACWPQACANDEACEFDGFTSQDTRVCGLTANPVTLDGGLVYGVVQSCLPIIGAVAGGGFCFMDDDCDSDHCLVWNAPDAGHPGSRCFGACRPGISGDCIGTTSAHSSCETVPLVLSGGTIMVNSCILDP